MEEKERYYKDKILQDCIMPEGLFEIKDRECKKWYLIIEDKKTTDEIVKVLNQQDTRIKELEKELKEKDKKIKELESENKVGEFWHSAYQGKQLDYDMVYYELRKAMDENQQLKQSQKQLAIDTLEKVMLLCRSGIPDYWSLKYVCTIIENQLKDLKH